MLLMHKDENGIPHLFVFGLLCAYLRTPTRPFETTDRALNPAATSAVRAMLFIIFLIRGDVASVLAMLAWEARCERERGDRGEDE